MFDELRAKEKVRTGCLKNIRLACLRIEDFFFLGKIQTQVMQNYYYRCKMFKVFRSLVMTHFIYKLRMFVSIEALNVTIYVYFLFNSTR